MKYIAVFCFVPVWGVICRAVYELFMFGWRLI